MFTRCELVLARTYIFSTSVVLAFFVTYKHLKKTPILLSVQLKTIYEYKYTEKLILEHIVCSSISRVFPDDVTEIRRPPRIL